VAAKFWTASAEPRPSPTPAPSSTSGLQNETEGGHQRAGTSRLPGWSNPNPNPSKVNTFGLTFVKVNPRPYGVARLSLYESCVRRGQCWTPQILSSYHDVCAAWDIDSMGDCDWNHEYKGVWSLLMWREQSFVFFPFFSKSP
jgi:hypothetical protein